MHVSDESSPNDSEPTAASDEPDREDALDLDAGFDTGESEPELDQLDVPPRRARRSPLVAALVLAGGSYLLASMWSDFRHWLRSTDDVEDLGHARDMLRADEFVRDFDNAYVSFEATVDLQHAAKLTTGRGEARYLRVREGGTRLFVQIPQTPGERGDVVPERFSGRMHRHGDKSSFLWARKFFENEAIVQTVDVTVESVVAGERNDDGALVFDVAGEDHQVAVGHRDEVRFVVPATTAVVQLGKSTWPTVAEAEATITSLGVPFAKPQGSSNTHAHQFVAAIRETERGAAQAQLQADKEVPANNADPKVGATVLSRTKTYGGTADQIEWTDAGWLVPLGYAHPGYEVVGDSLVPREIEGNRIPLPREQVSAVRLERALELDPDGYLLIVDETPSSQRMMALLFLAVCGIMGANLASLALMVRRRRS